MQNVFLYSNYNNTFDIKIIIHVLLLYKLHFFNNLFVFDKSIKSYFCFECLIYRVNIKWIYKNRSFLLSKK